MSLEEDLRFYQLARDPFGKGVPAADAYEGADARACSSRLEHLRRVGGVGLLTGAPGTGKTLALRRWAASLNRNECSFTYMCLTTVTTMEFYRQLCLCLGLEAGYKKVDMFRSVQDHLLRQSREARRQTVVAVDEAQFLSGSILRDLVMLTNFEMDSLSCVAFVLSGQPYLADILCRGAYEALRQRVTVSYEMQGVGADEALPWAAHMLRAAGGSPSILDEAAVAAAHAESRGSARAMGSLLTCAIRIGAQRRAPSVTAERVREAHEELALR